MYLCWIISFLSFLMTVLEHILMFCWKIYTRENVLVSERRRNLGSNNDHSSQEENNDHSSQKEGK